MCTLASPLHAALMKTTLLLLPALLAACTAAPASAPSTSLPPALSSSAAPAPVWERALFAVHIGCTAEETARLLGRPEAAPALAAAPERLPLVFPRAWTTTTPIALPALPLRASPRPLLHTPEHTARFGAEVARVAELASKVRDGDRRLVALADPVGLRNLDGGDVYGGIVLACASGRPLGVGDLDGVETNARLSYGDAPQLLFTFRQDGRITLEQAWAEHRPIFVVVRGVWSEGSLDCGQAYCAGGELDARRRLAVRSVTEMLPRARAEELEAEIMAAARAVPR
jgi:hypothetical protein